MKSKECYDDMGSKILVEEITKAEAVEMVKDWIESIKTFANTDMNVFVEYKSGSVYVLNDNDEVGTFVKSNIKNVILDDGCEYLIYGKYTVNEYGIPQVM